jgi:hypothetical protein
LPTMMILDTVGGPLGTMDKVSFDPPILTALTTSAGQPAPISIFV